MSNLFEETPNMVGNVGPQGPQMVAQLFDFGRAAETLSPETKAEYDAAISALKSHRETVIKTSTADLDKAIGAYEGYATAIQSVLDIINKFLPMGSAVPPAEQGVAEISQARSDISNIVEGLKQFRTRGSALSRIVSTLLKVR